MDNELLDRIKAFAERLAELGSLDLDISVGVGDGEIRIDLDGEDIDGVLCENARVLHAFNHLISQAFFKAVRREYRFVVDCNGFRAARTRELEMLAENAALQATQTRSPFRFQPMPANDRRIIHLRLAEESHVRTESQGSGPERHVVVFPDV